MKSPLRPTKRAEQLTFTMRHHKHKRKHRISERKGFFAVSSECDLILPHLLCMEYRMTRRLPLAAVQVFCSKHIFLFGRREGFDYRTLDLQHGMIVGGDHISNSQPQHQMVDLFTRGVGSQLEITENRQLSRQRSNINTELSLPLLSSNSLPSFIS